MGVPICVSGFSFLVQSSGLGILVNATRNRCEVLEFVLLVWLLNSLLPETRNQKPETRNQKPETRNQKQKPLK